MSRDCRRVIYGLFDPRDGELRYVGKTETGLERRIKEHVMPSYLAPVSHKNSWLRGLLAAGLKPVGRALQELPTSAELLAAEKYWIAFFRAAGCRLTNMTDGGEGVVGIPCSAETRAKMRAAKLGRKLSAAHRARIGAGHVGKKVDAATRAKLSAMKIGKPLHPATRAAATAAARARIWTPEQKAVQRANALAQWAKHKANVPKGALQRSMSSQANR